MSRGPGPRPSWGMPRVALGAASGRAQVERAGNTPFSPAARATCPEPHRRPGGQRPGSEAGVSFRPRPGMWVGWKRPSRRVLPDRPSNQYLCKCSQLGRMCPALRPGGGTELASGGSSLVASLRERRGWVPGGSVGAFNLLGGLWWGCAAGPPRRVSSLCPCVRDSQTSRPQLPTLPHRDPSWHKGHPRPPGLPGMPEGWPRCWLGAASVL